MWLHGPAGDVNGALLADGTILRFPPALGEQLAASVVPGQAIRADGWGTTTAYGTVVAVQTLGMVTASVQQPAARGDGTISPTSSR
jgi:hypothetical protein